VEIFIEVLDGEEPEIAGRVSEEYDKVWLWIDNVTIILPKSQAQRFIDVVEKEIKKPLEVD